VCTYHLFDDKHHPFPPFATEAVARGEGWQGSGSKGEYEKGSKGRRKAGSLQLIRSGLNAPAERSS